MNQKVATRDIIHIISRYSNWKEKGIDNSFKENNVYADKRSWIKFIDISLMSLGVAFAVAGIIFFFAYNWQDMNRLVKLGLIEVLLIAAVGVVLFSRFEALIKNIVLTGASVLTGVLFSVFGQIYQTGANAFDFFLGWTVFIVLWAVVSGFAPLWLLLISLVNITTVLYAEQIAKNWSAALVYCLLFCFNTVCLFLFSYLQKTALLKAVPKWFVSTLAIAAAGCGTISIISGILYRYDQAWYVSLALVMTVYLAAIIYSFKTRTVFYLFIVPLSVILIISAFLTDAAKADISAMLLFVSAFIISSITVLITQILKLNRSWNER